MMPTLLHQMAVMLVSIRPEGQLVSTSLEDFLILHLNPVILRTSSLVWTVWAILYWLHSLKLHVMCWNKVIPSISGVSLWVCTVCFVLAKETRLLYDAMKITSDSRKISSIYDTRSTLRYIPWNLCWRVTYHRYYFCSLSHQQKPGICTCIIHPCRMHLTTCFLVCMWYEVESVELRCRLRSLLDSMCNCSSTAISAISDSSTCSYPSLISRPCPAFHHLQCAMMLSAHCLAPHVAAPALQALKELHARPLIFKVKNFTPSSC